MTDPRSTYALTDWIDALPLGLPGPLERARGVLDRHAAVALDDVGILLQGLWGRKLRWHRISRIEVASRLDEAADLLLDWMPATRIPVVGGLLQRGLFSVADRIGDGPLDRLRERAGFSLARIHIRDGEVEVQRLPAVVALLYPGLTREVEREAAARGIPVERVTRP